MRDSPADNREEEGRKGPPGAAGARAEIALQPVVSFSSWKVLQMLLTAPNLPG